MASASFSHVARTKLLFSPKGLMQYTTIITIITKLDQISIFLSIMR